MDYLTGGRVIAKDNEFLNTAYNNEILNRDIFFTTRENKIQLRSTLNRNVMLKNNL